jgi:hypothetical protein
MRLTHHVVHEAADERARLRRQHAAQTRREPVRRVVAAKDSGRGEQRHHQRGQGEEEVVRDLGRLVGDVVLPELLHHTLPQRRQRGPGRRLLGSHWQRTRGSGLRAGEGRAQLQRFAARPAACLAQLGEGALGSHLSAARISDPEEGEDSAGEEQRRAHDERGEPVAIAEEDADAQHERLHQHQRSDGGERGAGDHLAGVRGEGADVGEDLGAGERHLLADEARGVGGERAEELAQRPLGGRGVHEIRCGERGGARFGAASGKMGAGCLYEDCVTD